MVEVVIFSPSSIYGISKQNHLDNYIGCKGSQGTIDSNVMQGQKSCQQSQKKQGGL